MTAFPECAMSILYRKNTLRWKDHKPMFGLKKPREEDILAVLGPHRASVDGLVLEKGHVLLTLKIAIAEAADFERTRLELEQKIRSVTGVNSAQIILTAEKEKTTQEKMAERQFAPQVKSIIAVASGKGGVGKS